MKPAYDTSRSRTMYSNTEKISLTLQQCCSLATILISQQKKVNSVMRDKRVKRALISSVI